MAVHPPQSNDDGGRTGTPGAVVVVAAAVDAVVVVAVAVAAVVVFAAGRSASATAADLRPSVDPVEALRVFAGEESFRGSPSAR